MELEESYSKVVNRALERLNHPKKTIAGKITKTIEEGPTVLALGEKLGWLHKKILNSQQKLPGFDHFSLEKQQEIYELVRKGLDLPIWVFEEAQSVS